MKTSRKAFTLVELIVVLGILALLLVLITPRLSGYIQEASETTAKANARSVLDASELYLMDRSLEGKSPASHLSSTGPDDLSHYLKLSEKDSYNLTLISQGKHKAYEGWYRTGDHEVNIPSLELAGAGSGAE